MSSLSDETFEVYVQMRNGGKDAKASLEALRARIEVLSPTERNEMVRQVKIWEGQRSTSINGVATKPANQDAHPARIAAKPQARTTCPRCGQSNPPGELFCTNCGNFLGGATSSHETVRLQDPDAVAHSADFFGVESELVLMVLPKGETYTIQPQNYKHEMVIGRSEGSTMRPDIDLSAHNAGEMGVSRLHVALQYNVKNNLLSVSDMKSANGTFINGQKLYPQEVRVLRDGDELRLGRLVLRVYFQHAGVTY